MQLPPACSGAGDARLLGTYEFLKEIGKVGGFKHDVTPFYQRWILGRGCPRLHAAFVFNRSFPHKMLLTPPHQTLAWSLSAPGLHC